MRKFRSFFVTMTAAVAFVSACHADTVSWNYNRYSDAYASGAQGTTASGIVSASYWNDTWLDGRTTNLLDNTGAASTIDISWTAPTSYSIVSYHVGADADGSYNREILNGYLNAGVATWTTIAQSTVTLSEIGYSSYDVIVYFSSDAAGRTGTVTDGTTTYYFNTLGSASISSSNAVLVQATDTTDAGYSVAANYAVFSGLSGTSQTLTVDIPTWGGIAAIQITESATLGYNSPANGATLIPVDLTSSENDLVFTVIDPNIVEVDVQFSSVNDPNLATKSAYKIVDGMSVTAGQYTIDLEDELSADLLYSTTYYWKVIAYEPNTVSGLNNIVVTTPVWSFTTESTAPRITTQPTAQIATSGQTATFTVAAYSTTALTYAWYQSDDAEISTSTDTLVGSASSTLTVTATADTYYYCVITNAGSTTAIYSDVVGLAVKRQVAYWTLDDLANGYTDASGEGHDADPNGTPSFVAGAGESTGNGAQVTEDTGWATAGTWNPSQYSGQITISLWTKWAGSNSTWQGLLSKRSTWGADTMMWQLESDDDGSELDFKNSSSSIASAALSAGEWEHIAVTFDGTTATIYRNGAADGSDAFTLDSGTDVTMTIGASEFTDEGVVSSTFNGALDEIKIYNYAMTNIEVVDNLYTSVSDKGACIYSYASDFDVDGDCKVNLSDFAALAQEWLSCGLYPTSYCAQ